MSVHPPICPLATAGREAAFDANAADWKGSGTWKSRTGVASMKVNGSPTKMTRGGVDVVRFDSDSDAVIWPLNVGPTAMPQATFAVCFYLNSKANNSQRNNY